MKEERAPPRDRGAAPHAVVVLHTGLGAALIADDAAL